MTTIIALGLHLFSFYLLVIGFSSLKDSKAHNEYGVESESLHKKFSWSLILFGFVALSIATFIILT